MAVDYHYIIKIDTKVVKIIVSVINVTESFVLTIMNDEGKTI